ncbi:hypothetical protein JW968_07110 [Candidatus Woesearchaeota archaeon]|nr:hypothetical protein [Candidatus Woesearchaeota archaeon]
MKKGDKDYLEMLVQKALQSASQKTIEDEIRQVVVKAKEESMPGPVKDTRSHPAPYSRISDKMKEFFNYIARHQKQEAMPYQAYTESTPSGARKEEAYDLIPEQMKTDADSMSYKTAEKVIRYRMMDQQLQTAGTSAEFVTMDEREKFDLFSKLNFAYNIWRYSLPIGS